MKIIEKIDLIHEFIKNDPTGAGATVASEIQRLSTRAIRNGVQSEHWKDYMCIFASNPAQLQRLIGNDNDYNQTAWGDISLAYVTANGMCGVGTTTGTRKNLPEQLVEGLDEGLLSDEQEIPDCPNSFEKILNYI